MLLNKRKNYYMYMKKRGLAAAWVIVATIITIIPNLSIAADSSVISMGGVIASKDLHSILSNIRSILPAMVSLILAVSFVAGLVFMLRAVLLLRHFGQVQNGRNTSLKDPLTHLIVGSVLIYMPSTTKIFSNSIFGFFGNNIFAGNSGDDANMVVLTKNTSEGESVVTVSNSVTFDEAGGQTLLNYINAGVGMEWLDLINTVVIFIQFIGFVAFIRGWFIIANASSGATQQGSSFSKGVIHIVGGIISINFVPFIQSVANLAF